MTGVQTCALPIYVDPGNEQDWFSLTLGWAIAKGLEPEEAHKFAIHIRYHTALG